MVDKLKMPLFIFIVAEDDYDRDHFISQIQDAAGEQNAVIETYYRHEVDIYNVLDSALNLPLFTERKIVILKYKGEFVLSDSVPLLDYFAKASPKTIFIVAVHSFKVKAEHAGEPAESMKELLRILEPVSESNFLRKESRGILLEKKKKKGREESIASWVQETIMRKGLKIGKDAALLLIEICGSDKLTIASEIEKLSGYKQKSETIMREDVKRIAAENRVFDVYALIDCIGGRKRAQAVAIVRNLIDTGINHSFILWHLDNFYSKAAAVKHLIQKGMDEEEAAKKIGQRFYIKEFLRNMRLIEYDKLLTIPSRLLEADRLIKSGLPERAAMEKLMGEIL